jgi:hypothetical protein
MTPIANTEVGPIAKVTNAKFVGLQVLRGEHIALVIHANYLGVFNFESYSGVSPVAQTPVTLPTVPSIGEAEAFVLHTGTVDPAKPNKYAISSSSPDGIYFGYGTMNGPRDEFNLVETQSYALSDKAELMSQSQGTDYLVLIVDDSDVVVLDFNDYMVDGGGPNTATVNTFTLANSAEAETMTLVSSANQMFYFDSVNKKMNLVNFLDSSLIYEHDLSTPDHGELETVSASPDGHYTVFTSEFISGIKLFRNKFPPEPEVKTIPQEEERFGVHQPSENASYFSNPFTTISVQTAKYIGLLGVGITAANAQSCPNIGVALIKMF